MQITYTNDQNLLSQADLLLYKVLWAPYGMPRDIRSTFPVDGEIITYVALDNGLVIGCVVLIYNAGPVVEIRHVAIDENYQGRGIGKWLVNEALAYISERTEAREAFLYSRSNKVSFYEKMGFQNNGEIIDLPGFQEAGVHFIRLYKQLS